MKVATLEMNLTKNNHGVIYGIIAYTLWGLLPLYWKILKAVPAYEILAHRVIWSFGFVLLIVIVTGNRNEILNILKDKKCMMYIIMCSILISVNWYIYIWSVNSNHIVEASMGYYINPLMSVLLGMIVLKEKLNVNQYIALGIAAFAVILLVIIYGSVPWVSLALAISFGLYGLCKKMVRAEATVGLAIETLILAPIALGFLLFTGFQGNGAFGSSSTVTILLALSGIATATPLIFFAKSAKQVKLSTLGFLQYISPTISLILGVFVYKEHFSLVDLLTFGLIWIALIIYSSSLLKKTNVVPEISN